MTRRFVLDLSPRTLREIAAAMEASSRETQARRELTEEGIERLAEILLAGSSPTVGFFLRYRKPAP